MSNKSGDRLRDWSTKSYNEDGRAVSSLDQGRPSDPQVPKGPKQMGVSGADNPGGSGDKGRRNR